MKTRNLIITFLIAFFAINSFSQTKKFINEQYIFNVNPKSSGYDFKVLDSITDSDTLALINNSVLGGKWVRGRNLPVKDVDINNYSHNGTLFSYLQGIDLALEAIQETTAGVLTRIYFTGDQTTIASGTYYLSNFTSKGTVANVTQTVSNGDNIKTFFSQDVISSASLLTSTAKKGSYTSSLSVSTESAGSGNDYSQRFTIEIYLTDNDGVPIPSGVTGAPIGDLGVTVLTILDSGVLNMPYDAITNITLTGNLNEDVTLLAGNRIRYHISAEKIGTNGGAVNQSLYLGSDHNSYYDVPTPILWGDIEGVLSNQVDLQNALDAKEDITNKGVANGYASLDPNGKVPLSQISVDNNNKVTSVFGRIGDIVALQSDYDTFFYTKTESDAKYLLNTTDTFTGDLTVTGNYIGDGSLLTNVDAEKLTKYNIGTNLFTETLSDFDDNTALSGIYRVNATTTNNPIGSSGVVYHMNSGATNYVTQIFHPISQFDESRLFIRHYSVNLSSWSTLREVIHDGNISDYADLPAGFYEEGTFTPTLVDNGGGATYSFTIDEANYIRQGNSVFFNIRLLSINTTGTPVGILELGNLPFNISTNTNPISISTFAGSDVSSSNLNRLSARVTTSNYILFKSVSSAAVINVVTFSSGVIEVSGTYTTNVYTP